MKLYTNIGAAIGAKKNNLLVMTKHSYSRMNEAQS